MMTRAGCGLCIRRGESVQTEVSKEALDRATQAIEAVAAKLGQGADYFWPVLVREQVVGAWASAVSAVIAIAFFSAATMVGLRIGKKAGWDEPESVILTTIGGIGALFVTILSIVHIPMIAKAIAAPEAAALRDVLKAFGG
jgi:hypothetical protein